MKKNIILDEIDCANCAAEVEREINKLPEVNTATVSFFTQKILLDYADNADFDKLFKQIKKIVKKVEPDCEVSL